MKLSENDVKLTLNCPKCKKDVEIKLEYDIVNFCQYQWNDSNIIFIEFECPCCGHCEDIDCE